MTTTSYRGPNTAHLATIMEKSSRILTLIVQSYAQEMHSLHPELSEKTYIHTLLVDLITQHLSTDQNAMDVVERMEQFTDHLMESLVRALQKRRERTLRSFLNNSKCSCAACQLDEMLGMPFGSIQDLECNASLSEVIINGTERRTLDKETFDRVAALAARFPGVTPGGEANAPANEASPAQPSGSAVRSEDEPGQHPGSGEPTTH